MESLLIFCCQSCLKGEHDNEYYVRLDLSPNASYDDIKRAYKKKSLQLHPDRLAQKGKQVTADDNIKFQQLKEAYDVLSDKRKRRLYDKLGKSGLKLIDSPQEINPMELLKNFQSNFYDRVKLFLLFLLVGCCILILPILFCLKCDGKIDDVPWLALWIPMWLINCIILISSILLFLDQENDEEDDEEEEEEKANDQEENDEEKNNSRNKNKKKNKNENKIPLIYKIYFFLRTCCFILVQIFVFMRLDEYLSNWSWFAIFAPWFIYEGFVIFDKLQTIIEPIPVPNMQELERKFGHLDEQEKVMSMISIQEEYFKKLMDRSLSYKAICVSLLRIWLACFLAVQLNHSVDWDWGLVLLPIWCYFLVEILYSTYLNMWGKSLLNGIDIEACASGEITDPSILLRAQHGQEVLAASSLGWCSIGPTVFMAVLLVSRLEAASFSTFIILIPIFAILGCCLCAVACGFCMASCVDTTEFQEEGVEPSSATAQQKQENNDIEAHDIKGFEAELPTAMRSSPAAAPSSPSRSPIQVDNTPVNPSSVTLEVTHIDADID